MSFRAHKGRLFLLGYNEALVGSLSNWADRLLALMEAGDFIGAIRLATSYYTGDSEKLTVGLPEEDVLRKPIVQEKLLEMLSASLKYAFGRNAEAINGRLDNRQLEELAEVSVTACIYMADEVTGRYFFSPRPPNRFPAPWVPRHGPGQPGNAGAALALITPLHVRPDDRDPCGHAAEATQRR